MAPTAQYEAGAEDRDVSLDGVRLTCAAGRIGSWQFDGGAQA